MTSRWTAAGVLLAAAVAGLGFAPVFGAGVLLLPLLAVLVPVGVADAIALRRPRLAALRAPLGLLAGVGAGAVALVVTGADLSAVIAGATDGWLRTLESTFPARPDPELIAFVPLLALLAGVLGVEWLRRGLVPLATLLPALTVLGVAQLYAAATGGPAVLLACGFGVAAAIVLNAGRWPVARTVAAALPMALVATACGWALAVADPLGRPAYSLQEQHGPVEIPAQAVNPLAEIGGRLSDPDRVVFTVATSARVDRWPLATLDGFDGAGWTSSARYRPLGAELAADPAVTVPVEINTADVELATAGIGPWVPTRNRPLTVDGLRPLVDPVGGTLLRNEPGPGAYTITWQEAVLAREQLVGAAVDRSAPGALQAADLPAGVLAKAQEVLGSEPPTFATALRLEKWFRETFRVAEGSDLPTGHAAAQLINFLDTSKRGTSEQFTAAYVLMARAAGLPVRLVVGFRHPTEPDGSGRYVVRNAHVLAWPEVAVAGVGWVPLDPTGSAARDSGSGNSVAEAAQTAREELSPPEPPAAPDTAAASPAPQAPSTDSPAEWAGLLLVLIVIPAVPVAKWVRRARRRRARGSAAVVGAWLDTRDRLRDHGVDVRVGMTVRDVAAPAAPMVGEGAGELERLARCIDEALWSGTGADPRLSREAWAAATGVRRALASRPVAERLRAALRVQSLLSRAR